MNGKNIGKAVQAGKKTLEELMEESPEFVQKVIKSLKGESDDAVQSLGSGKNLEALQQAKLSAPTMEAPAYPKNIGRDEVNFTMPPNDPGFTMPHPGAQVPALRTQTLPDAPVAPKVKPSVIDTTGKVIDEVPENPFTVGQAAPRGMADIADSLKGQVDDALNPGMSRLQKGGLAAAGLGAGALGLGVLSNDQEAPAAEIPVSGGQALAAEKAKELPTKQVTQPPKQAGKQVAPSTGGKPAQAPTPEVSQLDYLDLLKGAQQGQIDNTLVNNMLKAGQTIGSALSRSGEKPDYSVANSLQDQAGQGVANVLQQMKSQKDQTELTDDKKLRDPASDVSKAFRHTLVKLGIPHTEQTTAFDAKAMGINPQNLLMQDRALAKQMQMLKLKDDKDRNAFITGAQKTLQKPYKEYQKVASAKTSLENYLKGESSGPKDVAILYDFIRGLDPESAVKEGEIQLGKSAMSLFEQYGISARKLTKGDILSPKFRTAVADIMKAKEIQARSNYEELAQPFKLHGASRGLTEEDYGKFDYLSAADAKRAQQQLEQNPESVVPNNGGMVKVTNISTGKSKMMTAEQAARAPKDKYTVGQ